MQLNSNGGSAIVQLGILCSTIRVYLLRLLFVVGAGGASKFSFLPQVNTQAQSNVTDCSDRNNSKYYVVVVQVTSC